jgi:hypothetical protein
MWHRITIMPTQAIPLIEWSLLRNAVLRLNGVNIESLRSVPLNPPPVLSSVSPSASAFARLIDSLEPAGCAAAAVSPDACFACLMRIGSCRCSPTALSGACAVDPILYRSLHSAHGKARQEGKQVSQRGLCDCGMSLSLTTARTNQILVSGIRHAASLLANAYHCCPAREHAHIPTHGVALSIRWFTCLSLQPSTPTRTRAPPAPPASFTKHSPSDTHTPPCRNSDRRRSPWPSQHILRHPRSLLILREVWYCGARPCTLQFLRVFFI